MEYKLPFGNYTARSKQLLQGGELKTQHRNLHARSGRISSTQDEEMLRAQRSANGGVVIALSGRIETENIADVESLLRSEGAIRIVLDLKDVTLVNRDAVAFLSRCETNGIVLKNCPAYIREWITTRSKRNERRS